MKRFPFAFLATLLTAATVATAQPTPEIDLGARAVMSLNVNRTADETTSAVNDFSDTAMLFGAEQKLYSDYRGEMVVGFQFPEADSNLGQVFYHQVFVQLQNQRNVLKIGRSRLESTLIEFPTLRDDDAVNFTDVLNPFSDGGDSQDSQFGNVLEAGHYLTQRLFVGGYAANFINSGREEGKEEDFSINGCGLSLQYRVPESQRFNRNVLTQVGIGANLFDTDDLALPAGSEDGFWDDATKNVLGSTILNLYPDPVHFVDLRHQSLYGFGRGDVRRVERYGQLSRAESISTFTTLGYTYRKLERPQFRTALGVGYKTFLGLENDADQLTLLGNAFYRLGGGFDVGAQVQWRRYSGDLGHFFDSNEARFQIFLTYDLDLEFNDQFDDRDSILNLEHGYIE